MQPRLLTNPLRHVGASLLRTQSDERLVELVRDGHEPAFAALVHRYRGELERYCGPLVGPSRAEDAVQQTLINAHRALMNATPPEALRAWLYKIARNTSLNILRRDVEVAAPDTELPETDGRDSAADAALLRERLHDTLAALAMLPPKQRDALVMRELEGRSHTEIALALGVTSGAARQYVMRARSAMRAAITALTPGPVAAAIASAGGGGAGMAGTGAGGALLGKLGAGVAVTAVVAGGTASLQPLSSQGGDRAARAARSTATTATAPAPPVTRRPATPVTISGDEDDDSAAASREDGERRGLGSTQRRRGRGEDRGPQSGRDDDGRRGSPGPRPAREEDDPPDNDAPERHSATGSAPAPPPPDDGATSGSGGSGPGSGQTEPPDDRGDTSGSSGPGSGENLSDHSSQGSGSDSSGSGSDPEPAD